MRLFAGQYERTIDAKSRIQLPSPLRSVVDPNKEGCLLYVTLGTNRGTLAIYTAGGFEEVAARIARYGSRSPAAKLFRLQFFSQTSPVEMDKQGRFVLPDHLRKKAPLKGEVMLIGQGNRIEIWTKAALDKALQIQWTDDRWVNNWDVFLSDDPAEGYEDIDELLGVERPDALDDAGLDIDAFAGEESAGGQSAGKKPERTDPEGTGSDDQPSGNP